MADTPRQQVGHVDGGLKPGQSVSPTHRLAKIEAEERLVAERSYGPTAVTRCRGCQRYAARSSVPVRSTRPSWRPSPPRPMSLATPPALARSRSPAPSHSQIQRRPQARRQRLTQRNAHSIRSGPAARDRKLPVAVSTTTPLEPPPPASSAALIAPCLRWKTARSHRGTPLPCTDRLRPSGSTRSPVAVTFRAQPCAALRRHRKLRRNRIQIVEALHVARGRQPVAHRPTSPGCTVTLTNGRAVNAVSAVWII